VDRMSQAALCEDVVEWWRWKQAGRARRIVVRSCTHLAHLWPVPHMLRPGVDLDLPDTRNEALPDGSVPIRLRASTYTNEIPAVPGITRGWRGAHRVALALNGCAVPRPNVKSRSAA